MGSDGAQTRVVIAHDDDAPSDDQYYGGANGSGKVAIDVAHTHLGTNGR